MAKVNMKKSASPGAAPTGYTTYYFDTNGQLHIVQSDGTDVTIGAATLAGMSDVTISSPTNGQLLTYNSSTGKWENQTASAAVSKSYATRMYSHGAFS